MLQSVGAVWVAALLCILVCHSVLPADPWVTMLARPIGLIVIPLVVASIPLLAWKSDAEEDGYDEGDASSDVERKPRWKQSGVRRKMVLIWLVSLVVFGYPHYRWPTAMLDPILHNPLFLVFVPLLLACIPLLGSSSEAHEPEIRRGAVEGRSPIIAWKSLIAGGILAMILVLCLIGVYSMPGGGKVPVYCAITVLLSGDGYVLWKSVRQLRNSR